MGGFSWSYVENSSMGLQIIICTREYRFNAPFSYKEIAIVLAVIEFALPRVRILRMIITLTRISHSNSIEGRWKCIYRECAPCFYPFLCFAFSGFLLRFTRLESKNTNIYIVFRALCWYWPKDTKFLHWRVYYDASIRHYVKEIKKIYWGMRSPHGAVMGNMNLCAYLCLLLTLTSI